MGWTLDGYYAITSAEIKQFMEENQIVIERKKMNNYEYDDIKREDENKIRKYFYGKVSGENCEDWDELNIPTFFVSNSSKDKYYLFEIHYCNSIRDHAKLNGRDYSYDPARKEVPHYLRNCLTYITEPEDAAKVAADLKEYFAEDERLMEFAEWLEKTSKYCHAYRLDT